MSRLEDLIQQLCPDGVEYRPFGEIAVIIRGASPRPIKNYITTDNDGINWIKIGDVKQGSKYITNTAEKITIDGANKSRFVKEGDFILSNSMSFGRPYIMKTQGCIHDGWLAISQFSDYFNTDFLYHLLNTNKYQKIMRQKASFGGAVQNLNADIVRELKMPIVPIEIQDEIVRILDNFTELTARKKQYEYYRDKLLTFGDDVPMKKISDIAVDIYRGSGIKRDEITKDGFPCIRYGEIYTSYNISFEKCISHTSVDVVLKPKYFEYGDIIFAITGENIEEIGKSVVYLGNEKCIAGGDTVVLKHNQEPRYMSYVLSTSEAQRQKSKGRVKSKVVHTSIPALKEITIPVPDIKIQKKIADILDRFDTLCNDLSSGLPAEIEARKKQYEYYRDKLLNFDEVKH